MSFDPEKASFDAAVEKERRALVGSLPEANMVERTTLTLAGRPARLFTHAGTSADGLPIRHHQALIGGEASMIVLSAVGFERDHEHLRDSFEDLLKTTAET